MMASSLAQVNRSMDLAIDLEDNVYVAEEGNHHVQTLKFRVP
jgi:hypothetical protein